MIPAALPPSLHVMLPFHWLIPVELPQALYIESVETASRSAPRTPNEVHGLLPGRDPELLQNRRDVSPDCDGRDEQALGDLGGDELVAEQFKHFPFARREVNCPPV